MSIDTSRRNFRVDSSFLKKNLLCQEWTMSKNSSFQQTDKVLIICRCESVRLDYLRQTIQRSKVTTVDQLKKLTRAGMGPCQGRTCAKSVEKLLEQEADIPLGTEPYRSRPPVRNISIASLAASADQYLEPAGPISVVMLRTSDSDQTDQDPATEETD
jgi:bacterioferritin-associated ferredoxin